jgi:hypothetical protein
MQLKNWQVFPVTVSNWLRNTYAPVNMPSVKRFDQARAIGADESVSANPLEILAGKAQCSGRLKTLRKLARETGLEPAASAVTGRRSNQLSYSRGCRNQMLIRAEPRA